MPRSQHAPEGGPFGAGGERWIGLATAVAGALVLGWYASRYPPGFSGITPGLFLALEPQKLLSAVQALAAVCLINLAAFCLGDVIWRALPAPGAERPWRPILQRLGVGLLALSFLVLLAAALRQLHTPVLLGLLLLPIAVRVAPLLRALAAGLRRNREASPGRGRAGIWLLVGVGVLSLVGPFLQALGPECGFDALTYHLAFPERYLHENRIVVTPYSIFSVFPGAMEMLYLLSLDLGGEVAAKLLHFEFGALTLLALFVMGGRTSTRCALLAPLFLLAEPLFHFELPLAYNDLTGAFYALLATGAVLAWLEEEQRAHLVRAGIFAGGCLANRYLGGAVLLSLCVALCLPPWPTRLRSRLPACLWLGAIASLVLSPWLLRNLIHTGNPVSPVLQGLFHAPGAAYFDTTAMLQKATFDQGIGMGTGLRDLLMLPWRLTMSTTPGRYTDSFGYPINPLYLIGVLACLLLWAWRRRSESAFLLKTAGVFLLIWFYTFQESRYLLPAFPLLSLASAQAFDALLPTGRSVRSALLLLPAAALALCLMPGLGRWDEAYSLALGGASQQEQRRLEPAFEAACFLRENLGPDDRVLLVYESRSYLFHGLDTLPYQPLEAAPVLQAIHRQPHAAALLRWLRQQGITHILLNSNLSSRVRTVLIEGYGQEDFNADMQAIGRLLGRGGREVYRHRGIIVSRL